MPTFDDWWASKSLHWRYKQFTQSAWEHGHAASAEELRQAREEIERLQVARREALEEVLRRTQTCKPPVGDADWCRAYRNGIAQTRIEVRQMLAEIEEG